MLLKYVNVYNGALGTKRHKKAWKYYLIMLCNKSSTSDNQPNINWKEDVCLLYYSISSEVTNI